MNKHTFTKLCPLVLFAVLALFLLRTLWTGAQLYQSMYERENENRIFRTASQYLSTRLSQAEDDDISIGEFNSTSALFIADGAEFFTVIYCHDGYLRELYCIVGADVTPDSGEKLLALDDFMASESDGILSFRLILGEDEITVCHAADGSVGHET